MLYLRLAQETDVAALATLYQQTVRRHALQHYTPAQTEAWAAFGAELLPFRDFILGSKTYVAEDTTGIVGFASMQTNGHITAIYVRCDRLGQGIGSTLLLKLLNTAQQRRLPRLYAEASAFSLGLFQKLGFRWYATESIARAGVAFQRYLVERHLCPPPSAGKPQSGLDTADARPSTPG